MWKSAITQAGEGVQYCFQAAHQALLCMFCQVTSPSVILEQHFHLCFSVVPPLNANKQLFPAILYALLRREDLHDLPLPYVFLQALPCSADKPAEKGMFQRLVSGISGLSMNASLVRKIS